MRKLDILFWLPAVVFWWRAVSSNKASKYIFSVIPSSVHNVTCIHASERLVNDKCCSHVLLNYFGFYKIREFLQNIQIHIIKNIYNYILYYNIIC